MKRENLIEEYNASLGSLIEKTKFIYSEEFYELDEFEKKKYQNDKMTTEAHLGTLCHLLWGDKFQLGNNGLFDLFGLSIIGSMFNASGFGSPIPSIDYLKKTIEEDENKVKEQVFAIPAK